MSGKKKFQTRVESWTYLVDFWSEPRSSSETRSARAKTDRQRSMSVRTTTHVGVSWGLERARSRRTFITAGAQCGRLAQRQIWDCLGPKGSLESSLHSSRGMTAVSYTHLTLPTKRIV